MARGKVVVAMSGGVDSSVAALLLKEQGFDVIGVTMRLWTPHEAAAPAYNKRCCSVEDVADAQAAASVIGIPHYVINFEREFKAGVIDYFIGEYQHGRTPHPCIACNQRVKFSPLLERAQAVGAQYLATGHYARIAYEEGRFRLRKAVDPAKDQSYVLYGLGQPELSQALFPVGGCTKEQVRELARQAGLPTAEKPDSQDICFVPEGDYKAFLAKRIQPSPGKIVNASGEVLGGHEGIEFFTIGQRRSLGVQSATPLYVTAINDATHTVVVGTRDDLYSDTVWAAGMSYVSGQTPAQPTEVTVKYRYKSAEAPATLYPEGASARIEFAEPQRALTLGQSAVVYYGDEVLGGGVIERVRRRAASHASGVA